MDSDSIKRLRPSSSRNFSRPFPSPLSAGALNTPTRHSKNREHLASLPLSANHGNALRAVTSYDRLATNRLIDFAGSLPTSAPAAKVSHSNSGIWNKQHRSKALGSVSASSLSSALTDISVDNDIGVTVPIPNFRPILWRILEANREALNLDLFWPINLSKPNEPDSDQEEARSEVELAPIFPYDGLKPLLTFRSLKTLELHGMMQSYQPLIWATCWLNPNLTTLRLEMALEPLFNISVEIPYRKIDQLWSLPYTTAEVEEPEYLGYHGTGVVHEEFGDGEYLDTQAIKMAQLEVAESIPECNLRYLPIKKLTLMNFIIDSGPILRWFDPVKLEEITFKDGCTDAGFRLTDDMLHVKVQYPKPLPIGAARMIKPGELKVVELEKGKVVSRVDASGANLKESVQAKQQQQQHPLRHKFSQLLPKLGRKDSVKRNKENKTVVQEQGSGKQMDLETTFSEMEISKAKEGKKPVR